MPPCYNLKTTLKAAPVVGYSIKISLPSPPNQVTRSPSGIGAYFRHCEVPSQEIHCARILACMDINILINGCIHICTGQLLILGHSAWEPSVNIALEVEDNYK